MTVCAVVSQAAWAGNVVALPAVASLAGRQEWRHGAWCWQWPGQASAHDPLQ
jgi:hypothetical protein